MPAPTTLAIRTLFAASALILLAACSKPAEKAEEIRPVRSMLLTADKVDVVAEFSGEVRPRIEERLGFRVGGKIVARKVDVGMLVKRGQVLMQLDPQDLQLAQTQSAAGLKAAESNRDLARAELKRYQELRDKNFVSQAVLDSKDTVFKAAQASYDQAAAGYHNQSNQTAYTTLVADADGVITGVDAEAGQVVAAGAPVVRLARQGEKEVAISIPEGKVDQLRKVKDVQVRMWASQQQIIAGAIREISPMADPVTRTYLAKISIPGATDEVKLGMTAYVSFNDKTPHPMIRVPLSALVRNGAGSAVWVVENGAVRLAPVEIAGAAGNDMLLAAGVTIGQTIVTAGVTMLKAGQKVMQIGAEPGAAPAAPVVAGAGK